METLEAYAARWIAMRAKRIRTSATDDASYRNWIAPRLGNLDVVALTPANVRGWVAWIDERVVAGDLAWERRAGSGRSSA